MPRSRQIAPDSLATYFGDRLKRARVERGMTLEAMGAALNYSAQWIFQMEHADSLVSEKFAEKCAEYFEDKEYTHLYDAIQRAGQRAVMLRAFKQFVELQEGARVCRSYVVQLVPGLLQIPEYATGIMNKGQPRAELEAKVAERIGRQSILTGDDAAQFTFVIDEAALRRPVANDEIMAAQLRHLIEMAKLPNVQVRVLPFSSVTYAGLDGAYDMLGFEDGNEIVYVEGPEIAQVIEDRDVVELCRARFLLIMGEALPRAASMVMIKEIVKEYESGNT